MLLTSNYATVLFRLEKGSKTKLSFMLYNRVNRVSGFFTGGEILRLTQQFIEKKDNKKRRKTIKRLTMNENEILDLW